MTSTAQNRSLQAAKTAKEDEFYTQLSDIERELKHYKKHFKGKVVYCNCDDPRVSNFFHYFSYNFEKLGLKKLTATCYKSQSMDLFSQNDSEEAIWLEYHGDKNGSGVPEPEEIGIEPLKGDGDFRSPESIELLKQADIIVTNPPFSLLREYISQLMEQDKKFVIIGSGNALTTKDIFPLVKEGKIWLGYGFDAGNAYFKTPNPEGFARGVYNPETGLVKFRNVAWLTNLDLAKRHEDLILYKSYDLGEYPTYDNYDAIEVSRVKDIPSDFDGVMGVPFTFLDSHNPNQFEILGITKTWFGLASKKYPTQVQVNPDGSKHDVGKLNDGAALKVEKPPVGKTYYEVEGGYFVQTFPRLLIRRVN